MAYEGSCASNALVTGTQNMCVKWGYVEQFIRTSNDFSIASEELALLGDTWTEGVQNEALYPFSEIIEQQSNDEEQVNQELALGIVPIRKGKINRTFLIKSNPYVNKQLNSHDGLKSKLYLRDNNGSIRGVKGANGEFLPIDIQLFQVQKPDENLGSDTGYFTKVVIVISDVDSYNNNVAIIEGQNFDFDTKSLKGLQPVDLTVVGTPTATTLTVKATIAGTKNPVLGLSDVIGEDWTIKAPDGITENAPTTITDNSDSTYDFDFTALVTDSTVNLKAPSETGVTPGFKSNGAVTITFA